MYRIINATTGDEIAIVDKPRFIRDNRDDEGNFIAYIEADEDDAQGIAVNGTPYNLPPREATDDWPERKPLTDVSETVIYSEVDGGAYVFKHQNAINEHDALVVDLAYTAILLEKGVA